MRSHTGALLNVIFAIKASRKVVICCFIKRFILAKENMFAKLAKKHSNFQSIYKG